MFMSSLCRLKAANKFADHLFNLANVDEFQNKKRSTFTSTLAAFFPSAAFKQVYAESPNSQDHFMGEPIRNNFVDFWNPLTNRVRRDYDEDNERFVKNADIKTRFKLFIYSLQKKLCEELQKREPNVKFTVDRWQRAEGGGGITCILENGSVIEKAGVNVSVVWGQMPKAMAEQMRARGKNVSIPSDDNNNNNNLATFFAAGISSVIHPRNPFVPTMHFNYRYLEVGDTATQVHDAWFGGGSDLTPYYLDEQDVKHFHQQLKNACDEHNPTYYARFKQWCDDYFFIKHRGERRGVGGIFFDDLQEPSLEQAFAFVKDCGAAVMPSYLPLVDKNTKKGYGVRERDWQLLRRGRYVEFNLVYDRGTKFGLLTPGARYESILMSLPASAKWAYCHEPKTGSAEADLVAVLKQPKNWV